MTYKVQKWIYSWGWATVFICSSEDQAQKAEIQLKIDGYRTRIIEEF